MQGLRTRAIALALVLAMVLAACGGGGDAETEAGGDAGDGGKTDTSEPVEGEGGDAAESDGAAPDDAATDPGEGAAPAPDPATEGGAEAGGGGAPAAPPASTPGAAPSPAAAAAPTNATALARVLRVEDLPKGYQKADESVGENDEDGDFEEAFRKCMGVAGADANAIGTPAGQASRTFSDGPPNPQNPEGITSGVLGFGDAAAPERMVVELGKLFASEPGRKCIAEEIRKVIDAQVKTMSPTATTAVEAKQISAYSAGGGIAQLQLKVTVDFGAQKFVFYSDLVVVRANIYAAMVGFTNSNTPFDVKVGQPILDKAVARIAS